MNYPSFVRFLLFTSDVFMASADALTRWANFCDEKARSIVLQAEAQALIPPSLRGRRIKLVAYQVGDQPVVYMGRS